MLLFRCLPVFEIPFSTIPEKGGFTNFQNSNVHVKPNSGSAVFFSYFDPLTNATDNGLTQHSGCPVYEGEKKIITQWVRYGVSTETPHGAFNTCKYCSISSNNLVLILMLIVFSDDDEKNQSPQQIFVIFLFLLVVDILISQDGE